jgi:hypothetical protein
MHTSIEPDDKLGSVRYVFCFYKEKEEMGVVLLRIGIAWHKVASG